MEKREESQDLWETKSGRLEESNSRDGSSSEKPRHFDTLFKALFDLKNLVFVYASSHIIVKAAYWRINKPSYISTTPKHKRVKLVCISFLLTSRISVERLKATMD